MKREANGDEDQDGDDLQQHHDVVGLRGFADAANENDGEDHDNDERRQIESEVPPGP